jgi:phosphate transport system protein
MATTGHTVKAFDEDLDQLRASIAEMGGLVEAAIAESNRCGPWSSATAKRRCG